MDQTVEIFYSFLSRNKRENVIFSPGCHFSVSRETRREQNTFSLLAVTSRPQEKQTILEFENNRDKLDYLKALIKRLGG